MIRHYVLRSGQLPISSRRRRSLMYDEPLKTTDGTSSRDADYPQTAAFHALTHIPSPHSVHLTSPSSSLRLPRFLLGVPLAWTTAPGLGLVRHAPSLGSNSPMCKSPYPRAWGYVIHSLWSETTLRLVRSEQGPGGPLRVIVVRDQVLPSPLLLLLFFSRIDEIQGPLRGWTPVTHPLPPLFRLLFSRFPLVVSDRTDATGN
ncbi:hypothetical protein BXZ70DRAFT_924397 [Cristinia sonorae]|uniref:Uncharacterized protein n=1 Tax=Cristinia sonorae TaxID=1940300 RepID=A0A8K0UV34_9AGAR|nr:hypothetical protein BXZ70DRAFT_924397 [Cristinia sonorae]